MENGKKCFFKQLYQKCSKETNCISELEDDLISKLTGQPKIQGSMEDSEDFVLIPLCSFGTSPLENCHLFKASAYKHQKEKCFTFNDNLTTVFENDQNVSYWVTLPWPQWPKTPSLTENSTESLTYMLDSKRNGNFRELEIIFAFVQFIQCAYGATSDIGEHLWSSWSPYFRIGIIGNV